MPEYKLHPEGTFEAKVESTAWTETGTHKDQLVVRYSTEHGFITGWFVLTDNTAEKIVGFVRAMGYQGDDFADLSDPDLLKGQGCFIRVAHDVLPNSNKTVAKVQWVSDTAGAPATKTDIAVAERAKRFNALLRAKPASIGEEKVPFD